MYCCIPNVTMRGNTVGCGKLVSSISLYSCSEIGKQVAPDLEIFRQSSLAHIYSKSKGKVIPLQARCGPEGG